MSTPQTPPQNGRAARIAFGAAASAVMLLALLPQTGWIVREQMRGRIAGAERVRDMWQSVTAPSDQQGRPEWERTAARFPEDLEIQTAIAAQTPKRSGDKSNADATLSRLWEQQARFSDTPAFCATYLRYAWGASPRIGRYVEQAFSTVSSRAEAEAQARKEWNEARSHPTRWQGDPEFADRALAMADRGARLEPDNAVFPFTKAAILLALRRDAEAYAALHTAAQCSRWQEYVWVEAQGRVRLDAKTYGTQGALSRVSQMASLLFPQYASLRGAARVAVAEAIVREERGDTEGGLQIRQDLCRVASLMRHDSTTNIGSFVGMAINQVASARPGGEPPVKSARAEPAEQVTERRESRYPLYLRRIGAHDEARWVEQERVLRERARAIMSRTDAGWFTAPEQEHLMRLWARGLLLLVNTLWLLLGGGLARIVAARHARKEAAPLSPPARAGFVAFAAVPLLSCFAASCLSGLGVDMGVGIVLVGLTAIAVLAAPIVWLWRDRPGQERSRALRRTPFRQGLKTYAVTLAATSSIALFVGYVTAHLLRGPIAGFIALDMMTGSPPDNLPSHAGALAQFVLLSLAAPLLVAGIALVRSQSRSVPASIGLVQAFRQAALPGAACCLALYCGSAVVTLSAERAMWLQINRVRAHEGRYMGDLVGKEWPGAVPASAMPASAMSTSADTRQPR